MGKIRGAIFVLLVLVLMSFALVSIINPASGEEDFSGITNQEKDVDKVKNTLDEVPVTPEGGFDPEKFNITKTKAEQRIEAINKVLKGSDPFFMSVFKVPLRLSWKFVYLFFLVLFSLALFHNLPGWISVFILMFINNAPESKRLRSLSRFLDSRFLGLFCGFGFTFLLGVTGVFLMYVNDIDEMSQVWWGRVISIFALIFGILAFGAISNAIKQFHDNQEKIGDKKEMKEEIKKVKEKVGDEDETEEEKELEKTGREAMRRAGKRIMEADDEEPEDYEQGSGI